MRVDVSWYPNSRSAARDLQQERDYAEEGGKAWRELEIGDEAMRRWYDGSIDSRDTSGMAVEVRVDNLVLEVDFDHLASLGSPDSDQAEALATELVQEIENLR